MWLEIVRDRYSKTYRDTENPRKHRLVAQAAAWHYRDGDAWVEIDATPQRVTNSRLDGWTVTRNGWHYTLGKPADKTTDGWVGFGGRQGRHWLQSRLFRAGYLHWPTRGWRDIGGEASYQRGNLSYRSGTTEVGPDGQMLTIGATVTWNDLWTTPAGGISARWRVDGERLKEEVIVPSAVRTWLTSNRPPSTAPANTWFGFVFQVDWSDVPKVTRNQITLDVTSDFNDDLGGLELRDVQDELLGFLPVNDLLVFDIDEVVARTPLRKRFYQQDGRGYLMVGVRCDTLAGLPPGDLVFDPTIDDQVGAGADDVSFWTNFYGAPSFSTSDSEKTIGYVSVDQYGGGIAARFTGLSAANGGTIDTSYLQIYQRYTTWSGVLNMVLSADDQDDSPQYSSYSDLRGRSYTTATVNWDLSYGSAGWKTSSSLNTVLQELSSSGYLASGVANILVDTPSEDAENAVFTLYEYGASYAPKLHVEYTAGAAGNPYYAYAQQQ